MPSENPQQCDNQDEHDDDVGFRISARIYNARFLRSSMLTAGIVGLLIYLIKLIVQWIIAAL